MTCIRFVALAAVLSAALTALAQPSGSITVDQVLYAGRPDPQVIVTNSTDPNISNLESFLQNLPPTSPPNWPNLGPRGFLLENNNVPTFPQEVRVFQGVIRIFQSNSLHYFLDVHGLESELATLFPPVPSAPAAVIDREPGTPLPLDQLSTMIGLPTNGFEPRYIYVCINNAIV